MRPDIVSGEPHHQLGTPGTTCAARAERIERDADLPRSARQQEQH